MNIYNKMKIIIKKVDMFLYEFLLKRTLHNCGRETRFNGKINIINPWNVEIGEKCSLNHGAYINAFNSIKIGCDVTISANAIITSTEIDYMEWFISGEKKHVKTQGLVISDHVWIGAGATILPNANIYGEYVVIAAGAVVTKPVEDSYCILAGCPARVIKRFSKTEL